MKNTHYGFGATPRFSNLYKTIKSTTQYHYAMNNNINFEDPTIEQLEILENVQLPILTFTGSEKLHGENMAVCYLDGNIYCQGRNRVVTMDNDQNGMAQFVENHKAVFEQMFKSAAAAPGETIVLDGEWAGGNIQKGNAACSGIGKAFFMFDYYRIINLDGEETLQVNKFSSISNGIYLMKSFSSLRLTLDFNKPKECEDALLALALSIEENSPIAKYFYKPDNVGEGAYLWCVSSDHPTYRLKTKGEKHGGKPKTKREHSGPTSEEVTKLTAIAEQLTPVWRINQAISETGATTMKSMGAVMKWVSQDILKEEMPTILSSGFEFKQLQKYTSKIVKDYFIDYLKDY